MSREQIRIRLESAEASGVNPWEVDNAFDAPELLTAAERRSAQQGPAQQDWTSYLESRPYTDTQHNIHNPETGDFMPQQPHEAEKYSAKQLERFGDKRLSEVFEDDEVGNKIIDVENRAKYAEVAELEYGLASKTLEELAVYIREAQKRNDKTAEEDAYDVFVDKFEAAKERYGWSGHKTVEGGQSEDRGLIAEGKLDYYESVMLGGPTVSERQTQTTLEDVINVDDRGRALVPEGNSRSGKKLKKNEQSVIESRVDQIQDGTDEYEALTAEAVAQATSSATPPAKDAGTNTTSAEGAQKPTTEGSSLHNHGNSQTKSENKQAFNPLQNEVTTGTDDPIEVLQNEETKKVKDKHKPLQNHKTFEPLQNERSAKQQAKIETKLDTIAIARAARQGGGKITYEETKKYIKNIRAQPEEKAKADAEAKEAAESKAASRELRAKKLKGIFSPSARRELEDEKIKNIIADTYKAPETSKDKLNTKRAEVSKKLGAFATKPWGSWSFWTPTPKAKSTRGAKTASRPNSNDGAE